MKTKMHTTRAEVEASNGKDPAKLEAGGVKLSDPNS
jgi:hypothetical protein